MVTLLLEVPQICPACSTNRMHADCKTSRWHSTFQLSPSHILFYPSQHLLAGVDGARTSMRLSSSAATIALSSALVQMVDSFYLAPCSRALAPARACLLGATTWHPGQSSQALSQFELSKSQLPEVHSKWAVLSHMFVSFGPFWHACDAD